MNVAKKVEVEYAVQEFGTVESISGAEILVRTAGGVYRCVRAASCLLEPAAGDRVLTATGQRDECYVLAVLRRAGATAATVSVEGDLNVRLSSGRFGIMAAEGVEITAGRDVSVAAAEVSVHGDEGRVTFDRLSYVGELVQAEVDKARVVARSVESVCDRFVQRVKQAYRFVEDTDLLRARRIQYAATETASVHGDNTVVTAETVVKVDGAQIHVG